MTARQPAVAMFAAASFLAASLLFAVEPMVARMILPTLGGSAEVWVTAVVFFQLALVSGYGLAHLAAGHLSPRARNMVLLGGVLVSFVVLPVAAPHGWIEPTGNARLWLLALLTVMVALPFVVLAMSGPLIQRMYGETGAHNPYVLYAFGNAGSFAGLLAYPLVLEPLWGLSRQAVAWTIGFAVFGLLVLLAALGAASPSEPAATGSATPVSMGTRLAWLGLAFVPSSLLLGSTSFVTSQVGSFPLFWVLPLAVYLMTFVVSFRDTDRPVLQVASRWLMLLALGVLATGISGAEVPEWATLSLHLALLAAAGVVAHRRAYEIRPPVPRLTEFYLLVGVGGALGGLFNVFVATRVFDWPAEYPVMIVVATGLIVLRAPDDEGARSGFGPVLVAGGLALVVALIGVEGGLSLLLGVGVPAVVLLGSRRAGAFAAGLAFLMLIHQPFVTDADLRERTVYGVLSVTADDDQRVFFHGSTVHGVQFTDERGADPAGYYARQGPLGDVFSAFQHRSVAAVGLGAGAVATYATEGDAFAMIEIDPAVVSIARDSGLFTYLSDSDADLSYVVDDGRLALEADPERYDLIVLDAFTADAIPVHLLTVEAFESYLGRLGPGGAITVHISNRHFDLEPVLAAAARELSVSARIRRDPGGGDRLGSRWVTMTRTPEELGRLGPGWVGVTGEAGFRAWTDDYSNPLSVLRLGS